MSVLNVHTFLMALLCGLLVAAGELATSGPVALKVLGWVLAVASAFSMGWLFGVVQRTTR